MWSQVQCLNVVNYSNKVWHKIKNNTKLVFNQLLIFTGWYTWSSKSLVIILALRLKTESNHLGCRTTKKCLSVLESVEMLEKNKIGSVPFPTVQQMVSICKRNPNKKDWKLCILAPVTRKELRFRKGLCFGKKQISSNQLVTEKIQTSKIYF